MFLELLTCGCEMDGGCEIGPFIASESWAFMGEEHDIELETPAAGLGLYLDFLTVHK